jgi:hypothetical protein
MSRQIIKELTPSNIELKTRRTATGLDINIEQKTINTFYKEQKYYLNQDGDEVLVGDPTIGSWPGDYDTWFDSPVGQQIKAAIELELEKDTPTGNVS